jgi:short-subunit dehydrogenase
MDFAEHYGPWALVTGAARGLGEAFVAELLERGTKVIALDRDGDVLAERAGAWAAAGGAVKPVTLDLASPTLADDLDAAFGGREVGLLVNNAASPAPGGFLDRELDDLRLELRVNCEAALVLAHHLGTAMKARGRGGIVFVSSLSMLHGTPVYAHYAATKAYDAVLAQGLFEELAESGVDVTTVLGPLMDTPGFRASKPATTARSLVPTRAVARAALDGLGRRGRVVVGRDGHLVTGLLSRIMSHERIRKLVAANVRRMYPNRS